MTHGWCFAGCTCPCGCGDRLVFGAQCMMVFGTDAGGDGEGQTFLPAAFSRPVSCCPLPPRIGAESQPGPPTMPSTPPSSRVLLFHLFHLFLLFPRPGPLSCASLQGPTHTPSSGQARLRTGSALSLTLDQPQAIATPEPRLPAAWDLGADTINMV